MWKYKYKGKTFIIRVCDGKGWETYNGLFRVENSQPYGFDYQPSLEGMKEEIRNKYDQYHSIIPDTKEGWIKLFEDCVIRDGYETWYIDKGLAMRTLELYKEHSKNLTN